MNVFDGGPPDDGPGADRGPEVPREAAEEWWDPERAGLHGWLDRKAPHLAPLYLAGLRMAMDEGFPGRVHFIAHAIREIRNRLPDALDGALELPKSKYPKYVGRLYVQWAEEGFPTDGSGPSIDEPAEATSAATGRVVSSEFISAVGSLVAHHAGLEAGRDALRMPRFEALAGPGPHPQHVWKGWRDASRSAERFAHARNETLPADADVEWTAKFLAFERFLIVISKRAQENIADLDELLREANSRMSAGTPPNDAQLDLLQAQAARQENRAYFFDRLENPEWVEPLAERGFFDAPPGVVHDKEQGTIRFLPWPEGRYLVRMAPLAPDAVLAVLEPLPPSDNPVARQTALRIVGTLPDDHFGRLVPKVLEWLEVRLGFRFGDQFADEAAATISRLARIGEVKMSVRIAETLLRLEPQSDGDASDEADESALSLRPEPISQLSDWAYGQVIGQFLPDLVDAAGLDAVRAFSALLNDALRLRLRGGEPADEANHSYIWRPAVEDHAQNSDRGIASLLVSAVRDAAVRFASTSAGALEAVVIQLEKATSLHRRIALHVLTNANGGEALVTERIANRVLFDDYRLRHEYAALLRRRFGDASDEARRRFLEWVRTGPDLEEFRQWRTASDGTALAEGEESDYVGRWQRDWLSYVADHLPDHAAALYRSHVERYGDAEHPDFVSWTSADWGPDSPVSKDEMDTWPPFKVIDYLKAWRPNAERSYFSASMGDLGRVVEKAVAERAPEFGAVADSLATLDPTYVRHCLDGFQSAIKGGVQFDWEPVLRLMSSVVAHPFEEDGDEGGWEEVVPGWRWARGKVASLIQTGTGDRDNRIPFRFRETVWRIVAALMNDPNPSPAHEASNIRSMGPHTLSMNTNRGEAMRSVMSYALWCRRELGAGDADIKTGFDAMPEVGTVLKKHLDPVTDPSVAVRAVYGAHLPWLALVDEGWVAAHLSDIFPAASGQSELRDAAWNTYICWCQPYDPMFGLLRTEYAAAIDRVPSVGGRDLSNSHGADQKLGEHLVTFHWRGQLPRPLLERWFEVADDELAAHSMEFVGRALRDTEGEVAAVVLQRIRDLWDWRLDAIRDCPEQHALEASAFAATFVSSKLDDDWSLAALETTLAAKSHEWIGHDTIERLTEIATSKPATATRLAHRMLENAVNEWDHATWEDPIRSLLNATMDAHDDETRNYREAIIDHYVTRGYYDFKNLVQKLIPSSPDDPLAGG